MISQLSGACVRAFFVAAMVMAPSLLLPGRDPEVTDVTVLVALFAAVFVLVEYGSTSPCLIEFRGAPPFNRLRFAILCAMLVLIAVASSDRVDASSLSRLVVAVGLVLGHAMDFPLSPVRFLFWLLPESATPEQVRAVRAAAGLAYLCGLTGVTALAVVIRVRHWPQPAERFNLWTNMPTFAHLAGPEVVQRLARDGAVNILLGIALQYAGPLLAVFLARSYGVSMLNGDLMLVWVMTLWAYLPTSLFLRGIAMRRLSAMIAHRRRRLGLDGAPDPDFLPA